MINLILIILIIFLLKKILLRDKSNKCKSLKDKIFEKFKIIFRVGDKNKLISEKSKKEYVNQILDKESYLYKSIKNIKKDQTLEILKQKKIISVPTKIPEE